MQKLAWSDPRLNLFLADSDAVNLERLVQESDFVRSETAFDDQIGELGVGSIEHGPKQDPIEKYFFPIVVDVARQENPTFGQVFPDSVD